MFLNKDLQIFNNQKTYMGLMIDFVSPFFFKGKSHAWFLIVLKALSNKAMINGFGVCTTNVVKETFSSFISK